MINKLSKEWQVVIYGGGLAFTGMLLVGTLTRDDSFDEHVCATVDNEIALLSPVLGENDTYELSGIRMGTVKEEVSREDMIVGNLVNENLPEAEQEMGGADFFQLDVDGKECSFGNSEMEMWWTIPYVGNESRDSDNKVRVNVNFDM